MSRFPKFCLRCNRMGHYAEDCKIPTIGMCDFERDMVESVRKERNCILGIIATMVVGYLLLSWVGGTGL